jgi:phosphate transport system permease protein
MALLILPIIVIASRESISRIPLYVKQGAYALGATKWQVIRDYTVPLSLPGIMTGIILAVSRALGETAPLITIGALTYVAFLPDSLMAPFSVLPIQIFNWVSRPQAGFHVNAAAGIVILLSLTIALNGLALIVRDIFQRRVKKYT